jgi:hypothetical protein
MSTAFDSMFLPGGDLFASQDTFLDGLDTNCNTSFTSSNFGVHTSSGTVSPSDLFNDDPIMSAPPSTAFPNLNTPDTPWLDTPNTGCNTSPLVDGILDGLLNYDELDSMQPLFNDAYDQVAMPTQSVKKSSFTPVNSRPSTGVAPMVRQKSSPGRPPSIPFSHARKHSESAGVNKSSKSRKSLPEIQIDSEDDRETAKRKKNTAAARKSRQRKQEHLELADAEIQRLRAIIYRMGGDPDEGLE